MSKEKVKVLTADKISAFIDRLSQDWTVLGPAGNKNGDFSYSEIKGRDGFELKKGPVKVSPKELLIPQSGCLLKEKNGSYQKGYQQLEPRVIFGMRPCDVKAVFILDQLMKKDFVDEFYWSFRENTYLVSFACAEPGEHCFCTSMGGSPFSESNFDLELVEIEGGKYILRTGSKKGEELAAAVDVLLEEMTLDQQEVLQDLKDNFDGRMKNNYNPEMASEALRQNNISNEFWQKWVNACMECGSCSFACPTCYCFNSVDRKNTDNKSERLRTWDSCVLRGYTRMAGGENPVDEIGSKNRFMTHKLVEIKDFLGEYGCVGCGRCSEVCYVNNSMADFLQLVEEGV